MPKKYCQSTNNNQPLASNFAHRKIEPLQSHKKNNITFQAKTKQLQISFVQKNSQKNCQPTNLFTNFAYLKVRSLQNQKKNPQFFQPKNYSYAYPTLPKSLYFLIIKKKCPKIFLTLSIRITILRAILHIVAVFSGAPVANSSGGKKNLVLNQVMAGLNSSRIRKFSSRRQPPVSGKSRTAG